MMIVHDKYFILRSLVLAVCCLHVTPTDNHTENSGRLNKDYNFTLYKPFVPYEGQVKTLGGAYNYSQYQPFAKIELELQNLANDTSNNIGRSLFSIGKTFEGRDIWAFKVQTKASSNNGRKHVVLIDCGVHAREWITVSTCMYLIKQFTFPTLEVKLVIEKYDWVFIPTMNPDGYAHSWKNKDTRLWRKNRSFTPTQLRLLNETKNDLCIGVDINRNFDVMWGGAQAPANDSCNGMYPGTSPFSEKEADAFAQYMLFIKDDVIAYLSLHSYSQKWATPWGYKKGHPPEYAEMKRVADIAVESMKNYSGITYIAGPLFDVLYASSGTSTDWVYENIKVTYTYLIEMIPAREYNSSFMLPPEMMVLNAQDILRGIVSAANEFKDKQSSTQYGVANSVTSNKFLIVVIFMFLCISSSIT